ncbi:MAG: hypothetical protein EXS59_02985 [Candidatus Taylorbacteria bacterium]|nr:hypothetical protein [Candidatus Taylorbacteria bacterium]
MSCQKNKHFTWFLEPLNPETNQVLSTMLPEEDAVHDAMCAGKTRHNLWRCNHSTVAAIITGAKTFGFKFTVFLKEGNHGQIRPWKFEKTKNRKKR